MYAVNPDVMVGFSNGRVVLVPKTGVMLPTKYLTEASSIKLCNILSSDFSIVNGENTIVEELKEYLVWCEDNKNGKVILQSLQRSKDQKKEKPFYKLDHPIKIVLIPTWKCNRRCTYCGVPKISYKSNEKIIEPELLMERLQDAIDNGLQEVMYHGGEPLFYYYPIFKQINMLIKRGVNVFLSTKNYISFELATKLSMAGLQSIQLSIDTIEPDLLLKFYGEYDYAEKLLHSVSNLMKVGIKSCINIVVSNLNYKGVPNLLSFISGHGVYKVTLNRYRSGEINDGKYEISSKAQLWLYKEIVKHRYVTEFEHMIINFFADNIVPAVNRPICESGRIAMVFLPNGQACYCDFLCKRAELCFGSLKNKSIDELWNSFEYNNFVFPKSEYFYGSKCEKCSKLNFCIARGLCYVGKCNDLFSSDGKCLECYKTANEDSK